MIDAVFGFFAGIFAFIAPGLAPEAAYHGYVEADYVYAAAESAGRITALEVEAGDRVSSGQTLFTLDDAAQSASLRAAREREAVAQANWLNLTTGSRKEEVDVIRANLLKAEADLSLAELTYTRNQKLEKKGFTSTAQLDGDRANLAAAQAQVAQLRAQLEVAALPARDAQLVAAEHTLEAAKADAERAHTDLMARTVAAPMDGLVEQVFYQTGEVVGVGAPVIALLPPGALKARFFVPEAARSGLQLGDQMRVSCDGCTPDLVATLTYMASDPQHTPPIIYSRAERARLVFMVEAKLAKDVALLPGQPISISVRK